MSEELADLRRKGQRPSGRRLPTPGILERPPCSADPQAQFGDSAVGPIADRDRSRAPESPDREESAGGCYPHLVPMLVSVSSVMLPVYVTPVPLA